MIKKQYLLEQEIKNINFLTTIFMQTDRIEKQKHSTIFQSAPKRSLSYNDLKKKRLLRSQKSKTQLNRNPSEHLIVRTQKKKPNQHFCINTPQDFKKIQRSINELKDVFDEMKQKVKTKKYIGMKPFYTDREDKKKLSFVEKSFIGGQKIEKFYESVDMAGGETELIKQIISKKKSQRRLLKFDQIRAQVKRSKSKSKLVIEQQKSKLIAQQETAPNSKINNSSSQQPRQKSIEIKKIRVNKFQTVKQQPLTEEIRHQKVIQKQNKSFTNPIEQSYKSTEPMIFKRNQTALDMNKQTLGLKSQYRLRRKLKIQDFKTQRPRVEQINQNAQSEARLKFHRKLRKTNSQIVIKTKSLLENKVIISNKQPNIKNFMLYDKKKYMSRIQNKSMSAIHNHSVSKSKIKDQTKERQNVEKQSQKNYFEDISKMQKQNGKQSNQLINENNNIDGKNLNNEFQLEAINISSIQARKESSVIDISSQLSIVQVIQQQELQIKMKNAEPYQTNNQNKSFFNKVKRSCEKNHHLNASNIQNAQNIENLSNILDFVALPTKQLKIKINRSTKISKKKHEMEKFKKIFPMNFFNQN